MDSSVYTPRVVLVGILNTGNIRRGLGRYQLPGPGIACL